MILLNDRKLKSVMRDATSYAEWKDAAIELDRLSGKQRWKSADHSSLYDFGSIRIRLDKLRAMRTKKDYRGLLFLLNEGIHGNMGGMGKSVLYHKAHFGTKALICDYIEEISSSLELLASEKVDTISFEEKLEFFRRADHCFGRSALMMSGSGSLLFFHMGVAKTLWQHNLLPSVISGSSGGAFVGSLVCCHTDDELEQLFDPAHLSALSESERQEDSTNRSVFPQIMPVDHVESIIAKMIPDLTYEEAFERTGRQLNVSIAPAERQQTSRLLNSMTSPNVYIRRSLLATSAVPGIYPPVVLEAQNDHGERQPYLPSRRWVDGSVSDDLPAKRLARLYGVNHYIVSQTNPHVIPFISDTKREPSVYSQAKYAAATSARAWLNASAEILKRPISKSPILARSTNLLLSVINQDYIGDINILPAKRLHNLFKSFSHLSPPEIEKLVLEGERATWPKLEMIRVQTQIGRSLNRILTDFEERVLEHQQ